MNERECPDCRILSIENRARIATAIGASQVRTQFCLEYLADLIGAWYADGTYSALRVSRRRASDELDPDWLIMALRKAPRQVIHPGEAVVFEDY